MRQQAVVPDVDPERAEDVASQQRNHDAAPAKEPGQARENRNKMDKNDGQGISPFDAPWIARCASRRAGGLGDFKIAVVNHRFERRYPVAETSDESLVYANRLKRHKIWRGIGPLKHTGVREAGRSLDDART
jgi:hypothetical protein